MYGMDSMGPIDDIEEDSSKLDPYNKLAMCAYTIIAHIKLIIGVFFAMQSRDFLRVEKDKKKRVFIR